MRDVQQNSYSETFWKTRKSILKYILLIRTSIFTNKIQKVYSEPSHTSTMELFAKIDNGFRLLIIFAKKYRLRCLNGFWMCIWEFCQRCYLCTFPAGNYIFKIETRCEIWRRSGVFIVNFEHILQLVLVFLLFTLNR